MDSAISESIRKAFVLFGVESFLNLQRAYTEEDQRLMKAGLWDDRDPSLLTNQTKMILEQVDPDGLTEEDREWWHEIMWFWYHHAVSSAIWRQKDRALAQRYATKALEFQSQDHPNRITRLLWYLVHDQLAEAKIWVRDTKGIERQTGDELVVEYERGEFF